MSRTINRNKRRKKQPYVEIIDLKKEQKEYAKLCRGKSAAYKNYTSWEMHIVEMLEQFPSRDDLYNFKRYCMNQDRIFSKSPELFGSYVILVFTLILEKMNPYLPILGIAICIFYFAWYGIKKQKNVIVESCFFKDIIEIIEKMEKEQSKL